MTELESELWDRYNGCCEFCGYPLGRVWIKHHFVNRVNHGDSSIDNLRPRHISCERYAHTHYKHGNPEEGIGRSSPSCKGKEKRSVVSKRGNRRYTKGKNKFSTMPLLSGSEPGFYLRKVSKNRPLP